MKNYKLINNVLGWVVFAISATVYLTTIEPTASFWDCGEFISSAYKLEVGHPPGAPFFMLTANLFTQLASDPASVAKMVNCMSALFSALTILFLFWSITHLAKKVIVSDDTNITTGQLITIMGSGLVGALVYTFSDTFWFSAVEGEVYAYSSLFTALVFWLILKWEDVADKPHADRWIVLIAYLMGLSIGVHLLNLLCIPAIVLVYYYKKYSNPTLKGTIVALLISFAIVGLMMYGVVQGLVEVCGYFELFFVNTLGMPYNSGVYAYVVCLAASLIWAIWETMRDEINPNKVKASFILSVVLSGIPFIGNGYVIAVIFTLVLAAALYKAKKLNVKTLNTILICIMVHVIGYSSYALTLIRATADTSMNQNAPSDVFTLRTYLAREQYGKTPLIYGQVYNAPIKRQAEGGNCVPVVSDGEPTYSRVIKKDANEKDRYYISRYDQDYQYVDEMKMLFPRMYSSVASHVEGYKQWADIKGTPVKVNNCGNTETLMKPTFAENLRYFFAYQLNFMYWRYFMWNFSGRQNDIQGHGEITNGNWITGIKFIDEALIGPQEDMPSDMVDNKGHNVYYMLPLLLGLLGIFYQAYAGDRGIQTFWVTFFLFFMTGIAIVLYLNQTPYQPRERDYAYAGSFYAFAIWIGFGVAAVTKLLEKYLKANPIVASAIATVACLFVPIQMAGQNWDDHDRSGRTVARDFGANYLESTEPNAIIFTNGDNDTFPLWYAQEVEGIRTDVRVCNTSYLQTDWYIDQMKKQAYESAPMPISWTHDKYVQGTRDAAYVFPRTENAISLKTALDFINTADPQYKKIPGINQELDYIPSETLVYTVDSVAATKLLGGDTTGILKEMVIDLKGKNALGKQEIAILDLLQTNNFERPVYYAITVSPDQFVNLDPYFEQTGLAYQIVPKNSNKAPNTEKMFDNVMNKFKWGGLDKPGVYVDENVMRMAKAQRMVMFSRLAEQLANEGQEEKALQVLDKCMEVFPPENIPLDYSGLSIGELYYALGQIEKGDNVMSQIADYSLRNLNWYFRLSPSKFVTVESDLQQNMAVMNHVMKVAQEYDSKLADKYKDEFNNYRVAYNSIYRKE